MAGNFPAMGGGGVGQMSQLMQLLQSNPQLVAQLAAKFAPPPGGDQPGFGQQFGLLGQAIQGAQPQLPFGPFTPPGPVRPQQPNAAAAGNPAAAQALQSLLARQGGAPGALNLGQLIRGG